MNSFTINYNTYKNWLLKPLVIGFFLSASFLASAQNLGKYHVVQAGENLYRIAHSYKMDLESLLATNPDLSINELQIGDKIYIPGGHGVEIKMSDSPIQTDRSSEDPSMFVIDLKDTGMQQNPLTGPMPTADIPSEAVVINIGNGVQKGSVPAIDPEFIAVNNPNSIISGTQDRLGVSTDNPIISTPAPLPKIHVVQKGETAYSIARMYNQDLAVIKTWNQMGGSDLSIGQQLIVGWRNPNPNPTSLSSGQLYNDNVIVTKIVPRKRNINSFERKYIELAADPKYKRKSISGIAEQFNDGEDNSNNMYILHKTAPLRSVVRVTNPINNRTVYAMVMERVPDTMVYKDVLVQIPSSLAKKLNMLDKRSLVACTYYLSGSK